MLVPHLPLLEVVNNRRTVKSLEKKWHGALRGLTVKKNRGMVTQEESRAKKWWHGHARQYEQAMPNLWKNFLGCKQRHSRAHGIG